MKELVDYLMGSSIDEVEDALNQVCTINLHVMIAAINNILMKRSKFHHDHDDCGE